MKKILLLCIMTFVLASTQAEARTFSLDIIQGHGPLEVSRQDAIGMFKWAQLRLAEAGVYIRLRRCSFTGKRNPQVTLANWSNQFWWWSKELWPKVRGLQKNQVLYVMIPPIWAELKYWIGGQAYMICAVHAKGIPIAVGNAEVRNPDGELRWYHSAVILAHELAHLFGAKHYYTWTIMHPAATSLGMPMEGLRFDEVSIEQIHKCIGW